MPELLGWFSDGMILFGGFLSFLLAIGEFPSDRKHRFQVLLSLTLVSLGFMQLSGSLVLNPNAGQDLNLKLWNLPLLYIPPAFAFLALLAFLEEDFRYKAVHSVFFLPFLICLGAVLFFRLVEYAGPYPSPSAEIHWKVQDPISGTGILYLGAGIFALSFVFPIFKILPQISELKFKILFGIFALDCLIVSVFGMIGLIFNPIFLKLALLTVTLAVSLVYYIRRKYFDFPETIRSDLAKVKYSRTRLDGLKIDPILEKLNLLFESEKIHRREDLSLAELAKELSLTTHQFSELINNKIGKGYFALINHHRIEDAKRLLSETDKTVLEIAMTVGFNNRSSFNEAFLKLTQKTPISYRKMCKPL
ncbi:helix-turn-helix domain-containing protein [Leptospira dzoumogneensis]|uniref:AraC family transcriptional regulator n=1 Tax=Leptospira dzoumogneensis TaxID=2484904 RepID=A0A4Z1AX75_9LEPT|nr:helix-turn-helix domain-containing protein [Leptospira dzoumogneensis]TGN02750.1 AraC family transcriptional regulator [Leptospira dzoumogneensis]